MRSVSRGSILSFHQWWWGTNLSQFSLPSPIFVTPFIVSNPLFLCSSRAMHGRSQSLAKFKNARPISAFKVIYSEIKRYVFCYISNFFRFIPASSAYFMIHCVTIFFRQKQAQSIYDSDHFDPPIFPFAVIVHDLLCSPLSRGLDWPLHSSLTPTVCLLLTIWYGPRLANILARLYSDLSIHQSVSGFFNRILVLATIRSFTPNFPCFMVFKQVGGHHRSFLEWLLRDVQPLFVVSSSDRPSESMRRNV